MKTIVLRWTTFIGYGLFYIQTINQGKNLQKQET
jgi:hypothetical protein